MIDGAVGPAPVRTSGSRSATVLPWRQIVRWALLGTVVALTLVLVDVHRHGGDNPVSLIQPGASGPATAAVAADFPEIEQPAGLGLDGQQYYAIARNPLHVDEASTHLDAPRYRMGRPLLAWMAWAAQPTGGGLGLVSALFLVGVAGVLAGALATGALSTHFGGPAWAAALFPILPGAYWSLRVTVSDALALGLAFLAVALTARRHQVPALAVGVLAVLAKEPVILVFLGWALHRRTRRDALLLLVPALALVGWMGWLRIQLPEDPARPADLGFPLVGLADAWSTQWSRGQELVGMACTIGGIVAGAVALTLRRLRHPLGWAIAVQLGFLAIMGRNPTAMNFGASRMAMPVMVLAALALLTPDAASIGADGRVETVVVDPPPLPSAAPSG